MRAGVLLLPLVMVLVACGGGSGADGASASGAPSPDGASASGPASPNGATNSSTSPKAAAAASSPAAGQSAPASAGTAAAPQSQPAPAASSTRVAVAAPAGALPMPGQQELPPEEELNKLPEPTPGGGTPPIGDACALVPGGALAVLAPGVTGSGASIGSEAFSGSGCTWGKLGDNSLVSLYVLTPGKLADPGALLVPGTGAMAAPNPPGGNLWGTATISGTSGPGLTYGWTVGGKQVVLTYVGPVDDAVRAASLEAARAVNAGLGG